MTLPGFTDMQADTESARGIEDPLSYLPCSKIVAYKKGTLIYNAGRPSTQLHLIISGTVAIECLACGGIELLVDIYKTDELFGESALIGLCDTHEKAITFEDTKVMVWTRNEVEELILRQPRLGVALLQTLTRRSMELTERIESFSSENIEHRLMRSLLRFADHFGEPGEDGSIHMMPISHELLSRYLGTSREVVTQKMNELRRRGCMLYSRESIVLYPDLLRKAIAH
jgi:CRP/FNR family transcriptional regulator